jgi:hypothetical protein
MSESYEPASDFLKMVAAEEAPLSGSLLAEENLQRLIAMTRDADLSNRDWATMLLAQEDIDTTEVRAALLNAMADEDDVVRAEALLGLARRDAALALPFALKALAAPSACMAVFEAAELIADPSLIDHLRPWTLPSGNDWLDQSARNALAACKGEVGHNR